MVLVRPMGKKEGGSGQETYPLLYPHFMPLSAPARPTKFEVFTHEAPTTFS
jgi:hypothetical protein